MVVILHVITKSFLRFFIDANGHLPAKLWFSVSGDLEPETLLSFLLAS